MTAATAVKVEPMVARGQSADVVELPIFPIGVQLAGLSELDRSAISRLRTEPVSFIDHELFGKPNVEKVLFGTKARLQPDAAAFVDDPSDPIHELRAAEGTLTTTHEVLLFQRYNYTRKQIVTIMTRYAGKSIPTTAMRGLIAWWHRMIEARDLITQVNMPLVLAMGKRTRLGGLDFNELVSEGNFALLRSVDKFDASRGCKFSTYACRAILKSFSRVAMKTSRYRTRFPTEFDPTLEKGDFIDRKRDNAEADCVEEIHDILTQNQAKLSEVERIVIRERFALNAANTTVKPKTLEQVGNMIGVTKERVRQIQNKALKKIRTVLEQGFLAA